MFSKSTLLGLFTLALSTSVNALPKNNGGSFETDTFCNTVTIPVSTVVQTKTVSVTKHVTHTVSVSSSQSTGKSSSGSGSSSSNNGSSSNKGSSSSGSSSNNGSSGSSSNNGSSSSGSSSNKGSSGSGSSGLSTTSIDVSISSGNNAAAKTTTAASSTSTSTSGGGDEQSSFNLDPNVVCVGFKDDGQNPPVTGQSPSLTSTNNFINYCALTLPQTPLTCGLQITTGSCNPVPIGSIPAVQDMPSAKFSNPSNFETIAANTAFTITMNIQGMQVGSFTNAQKTYFAAPQQLNPQGQVIGHSHFVVESIASLDDTQTTDSRKFIFFKGINDAGVAGANGGRILSTPVAAGVPPGTYRLCSINTSSNHVPVIAPVAQHGSFDDCTYFTASADPNAVSASASVVSAVATASGAASDVVGASASGSAVVASATAVASGAVGAASAVASGSAVAASATVAATGKDTGKNGKSTDSVAVSASVKATSAAAPAASASASAAVVATGKGGNAQPAGNGKSQGAQGNQKQQQVQGKGGKRFIRRRSHF